MAAQLASLDYQEATRKWRDLAERRRAHFVDLYESGRWRHYYSEEEFRACLHEVNAAAEAWARLVPRRTDWKRRA